MSNVHQSIVDEQTALLVSESNRHSSRERQRRRTPIPKLQLAIVLLLQACEPVTRDFFSPYINELIADLDITGGNKAKVGYYAGLINSVFFALQAVTILQWGRISDRIGRKPVLLIGLMGSALSMLCFGLSRTFAALVISRCLCGMLDGNEGITKTVVGEMLDTTNRQEGFALLHVVWPLGSSVAVVMGGSLARPHERFPSYFKDGFWREYPYFLSSLGPATIVFISFLIALFFKETLPKRRMLFHSAPSSTITPLEGHSKPVPLGKLLTYPVILATSNYVALSFMNVMSVSLLPLFMAMPIELGGLGFTPMTIGYVLGAVNVCSGLFSMFFLARLIRRFGERPLFIVGMLAFSIIFIMLPLVNMVARRAGVTWVVWCLFTFSLSLLPVKDMCFGCIFIFITASSPNKNSLGATNGIVQTIASFALVIGPALVTSLFAFSVERNILGGYAVYPILFSLSCVALLPAVQLPVKPWDENDNRSQ